MKSADPPVVVEQSFTAPITEVWQALTDADRMRQWFFDNIPDFKPEVGFETTFVVKSESRQFPHHWKVTRVEPNVFIAYDWWYDTYPGMGHVAFELSGKGSGTDLKLTMTVQRDFPDDIPEFQRESCIGGWNYFLKERLVQFLSVTSG